MDTEAERWKAEYRSLLEEQDLQTRQWSAMRSLLQDMLRSVLNACVGWSDEIDEEIEVLRIQVERADTPEQLESLQKAAGRISAALRTQQRETQADDQRRDFDADLEDIRRRFVAQLAAEPLLSACVEAALGGVTEAPTSDGLDSLGDALIAAFRELSAQKAEAERFVSEVTVTLASLERWAADGASRVDAQRLANQGLQADVDREVSTLQTQVEGASSLDALKQHMHDRLAAIATRIQSFRDQEDEKLVEVERQNASLNSELIALQARTEKLNEQLHEQEQLLLLDTLTQVHSRFAYERRLDEEIAVSLRSAKPLCYALWDIDFFKRINDEHGHQAGDAVLAQVASYLSRYTRSNDFVARIGGEEFVVLFPDTSIDDATMIAEKLRALIAAAEIAVEGVEIPVTISCGISALKSRDGAEQLYRRADEALYAAKDAGRNRCMAA
ncbi:MAG: GGDEF domain-containing protein [Pseudomonadota bacterium]